MIKIYCIGLAILFIAIISNALIGKIGLLSWYDFLNKLTEEGFTMLKSIRFIDYLWLFMGYPFVLGLGYILGAKLYELFT